MALVTILCHWSERDLLWSSAFQVVYPLHNDVVQHSNIHS